ncbi:hypothetical protein [Caballeronia pedi]|uniref:hypothetical protein n=1 Tax=Caballeronia pedi TaxID=1777141 RepID=UPI0011781F38|nr:hypothetical protein [Caballeronia pedi]
MQSIAEQFKRNPRRNARKTPLRGGFGAIARQTQLHPLTLRFAAGRAQSEREAGDDQAAPTEEVEGFIERQIVMIAARMRLKRRERRQARRHGEPGARLGADDESQRVCACERRADPHQTCVSRPREPRRGPRQLRHAGIGQRGKAREQIGRRLRARARCAPVWRVRASCDAPNRRFRERSAFSLATF